MTRRQILGSVADSIAGFVQVGFGPFSLVLVLGLAAAFPTAVGAQINSHPISRPFVVSVSEVRVDNEDGVTNSECVMVQPDGRFHLERRRQLLPNPTATLDIFESSLDSSQFQHLQDIVSKEGMSRLPEDIPPPVSIDALRFSNVTVRLDSAEGIRRGGYWVLYGRRPGATAVPGDVQKRWQESQTALRPLVEWLHGVEALKLPPSDATSTQCSPDEP
jgi:hypothetical protein